MPSHFFSASAAAAYAISADGFAAAVSPAAALFVLWAIGASNTSLFPFLHLPFLHSVFLVLQTPFLHFVTVELLLLQLLLLLPLFVLWAIGASNASLFPSPRLLDRQLFPVSLHPGIELTTTTIRERSMRKDTRRDMVVSK